MGTYVSVKNVTLIVIPVLITGAIIEVHTIFYQFLAPVEARIGNTTITIIVKCLPALSTRLRPLTNVTISKHITFLNSCCPINGRATPFSHIQLITP
jgi:hypothetical protein